MKFLRPFPMRFVPCILVVVLSLATPASALVPPASAPSTRPADAARIEPITIAGRRFRLEVAADEPSRNRGLMHRTEIAPDGGMLFIHPQRALQGYWMKHCVIEIDILFLDDEGRITAVHAMKPEPPRRDDENEPDYERRLKRYSSDRPARFAIELPAGSIKRLELREGMKIDAAWSRLKKLGT